MDNYVSLVYVSFRRPHSAVQHSDVVLFRTRTPLHQAFPSIEEHLAARLYVPVDCINARTIFSGGPYAIG